MGDVLGGGKVLMDRVRDNTTASVDQMLDGTMKGITAQKIQEKIKVFDKEQMETVEWLVVQVVDLCLHNMLWMVEQEEEITLLYQGAGLPGHELAIVDGSIRLGSRLHTGRPKVGIGDTVRCRWKYGDITGLGYCNWRLYCKVSC